MRRITAIFLTVLLLCFAASCSNTFKKKTTKSDASRASSVISGGLADGSSADSVPAASVTTGWLESEAARLHSTTGRVALSMIIHKLDGTQSIDTLASKNASELFSQIEILAPQKSQTLEALDRLYALRGILASEKIYVLIQANDVVSAAPSSAADWEQKFESAIKSGD